MQCLPLLTKERRRHSKQRGRSRVWHPVSIGCRESMQSVSCINNGEESLTATVTSMNLIDNSEEMIMCGWAIRLVARQSLRHCPGATTRRSWLGIFRHDPLMDLHPPTILAHSTKCCRHGSRQHLFLMHISALVEYLHWSQGSMSLECYTLLNP